MKNKLASLSLLIFILLTQEHCIQAEEKSNSNALILGYDIPYSLRFDSSKWVIFDKKNCNDCNLRLKLILLDPKDITDISKAAHVEVYIRVKQDVQHPYNYQKKYFSALSSLPGVTEVNFLEEIPVNDHASVFIIEALINNENKIFYNYVYSDTKGIIIIEAIASKELFKNKRAEIEDLLKGFEAISSYEYLSNP